MKLQACTEQLMESCCLTLRYVPGRCDDRRRRDRPRLLVRTDGFFDPPPVTRRTKKS